MGYGVVMRERSDTHLMAEDRDTVSLGLPLLHPPNDGVDLGPSVQHREPRIRP
jgi:hypothetical protein